MDETQEKVRRKFLLSASAGLALAIVFGAPIGGWLAEPRGRSDASPIGAHLAIAAAHKALWDIQSGKLDWNVLENGRSVAGYDDDVLYRDVPGGAYRVRASYEAAGREVVLTGFGLPAGSRSGTVIELHVRREGSAYVQTGWREVR